MTKLFLHTGLALGFFGAYFFLESTFYHVQFNKGDGYYVHPDDIYEQNENEIVFKDFFTRRIIRGNDYRISEPLFSNHERKPK